MSIISKNKENDDFHDNDKHMHEGLCKRNPVHFCEVLVGSKIILNPQPREDCRIKQHVKIKAKIEKVCCGKMLINGIIRKTICYKAIHGDFCSDSAEHLKHEDIPFICFIDVKCGNSKDNFEIVSCESLCAFSKIHTKEINCSSIAILEEKDLIKIKVRRKPCSHEEDFIDCKFCSKAAVSSEICFVPAVNPDAASVSVESDPCNFKVELVCCGLIVVCGFITKKVTFCDGTPAAVKDIPVQISIPAAIDDLNEAVPEKWKVTKAEVCTGCYEFICPDACKKSHKLTEKDIIAVEVSHKNYC
ncbi:MAG: hypothetical protein ABRQ25_11495 [Clostridiaceae bacterium]